MMFGYDDIKAISVHVGDPTEDRVVSLWRAPMACEILSAYVVDSKTLAAGTANYWEGHLENGGTAGTGTTAITANLGGTAAGGTAPGWTANTPQAYTVSEGTLASGEWVNLDYDETGTVTPDITIIMNVVYGIGA